MKISSSEEREAIDSIKHFYLPKRVRIILYIVSLKDKDYYDFPVNKLRNIAITNIVTSHFLVLDMDMWPASRSIPFFSLVENLYDELTQLPTKVLKSSTAATIIPAFFLNKQRILSRCKSLLSCAIRSEMHFPSTRQELYQCIRRNRCLISKVATITHVISDDCIDS